MPSRRYYSDIGRKGGLAGKGSARKLISARAAAQARWRKSQRRPVTLAINYHAIQVSRRVDGLKRALTGKVGRRVGHAIKFKSVTLVSDNAGGHVVAGGMLHRVRRLLSSMGIKYRLQWESAPATKSMRPDLEAALDGLTFRQRREMEKLLREPLGALCRSNSPVEVMLAVLRAYPEARALIVVEKLEALFSLHALLKHHLQEPIGVLAGTAPEWMLNQERVTLVTPAQLLAGVISPDECEVLIFARCPRTGYNQVNKALSKYSRAWRLAFLGTEKRGPAKLLLAEATFGRLIEIPFRDPIDQDFINDDALTALASTPTASHRPQTEP